MDTIQLLGIPILGICAGAFAGLYFALKRSPRWWMFLTVSTLMGLGAVLTMPIWFGIHTAPEEAFVTLVMFGVPIVAIALLSRAGWGRSMVGGIIAVVTFVLSGYVYGLTLTG